MKNSSFVEHLFRCFVLALEYKIVIRFGGEITGYYLKHFTQASKGGKSYFYKDTYKTKDNRERVLAIGPCLGYLTATGLFLEVKNMWETSAQNRTNGCNVRALT